MERRARQMRDRSLQSVQAIVKRQQRMPSQGDHDRLFFNGQDLRSCPEIGDRVPGPPFGYGLRIDGRGAWPALSLDGPPLSLWRSHEEPGP
jgi:hypothetical protein